MRTAESGPNLLNRIHFAINRLGYSKRTEQAYTYWARYLLKYHRAKQPIELTAEDVETFLKYIASQKKSSTTVNAALNAINFFFKRVLEKDMGELEGIERPKSSTNLPVVFFHEEATSVLRSMNGVKSLTASLLI